MIRETNVYPNGNQGLILGTINPPTFGITAESQRVACLIINLDKMLNLLDRRITIQGV